ncbi:MAG: ROK family protein [Elusimicrobiota bacterium]
MLKRVGLGIDTGGTFTKILAVSESGQVLRRLQVRSEPHLGPARFIPRVAAAVRRIERSLGRSAQTACLAVAGDVDPVSGRLRRSPNLPAFEDFPLRERLSRALSRPVEVHNDANMAAWGCYTLEFKRRCPNVVGVTMGTGVGGGVVLDGRLVTGATGSAGEIGHVRVAVDGAVCRCGARGCLEAYAGKYGVTRIALELLREKGETARGRFRVGESALQPHHLAAAAAQGDRLAREVWRRVGRALAVGIVNVVYLLNPDAIIFAGGVSRAAPYFMGSIRRALRAETFRAPFGRVRIAVARREDMGALGAALYSLEGPH